MMNRASHRADAVQDAAQLHGVERLCDTVCALRAFAGTPLEHSAALRDYHGPSYRSTTHALTHSHQASSSSSRRHGSTDLSRMRRLRLIWPSS